jgi:hypothetical protein
MTLKSNSEPFGPQHNDSVLNETQNNISVLNYTQHNGLNWDIMQNIIVLLCRLSSWLFKLFWLSLGFKMLSVAMLSVLVLNVVAPQLVHKATKTFLRA